MVHLYVDIMIYADSNANMVKEFKNVMMKEYDMIDFGLMRHFLTTRKSDNTNDITDIIISVGKHCRRKHSVGNAAGIYPRNNSVGIYRWREIFFENCNGGMT